MKNLLTKHAPSPAFDDDDLTMFATIGQDVVTHSANRALAGKMPTSRRCKTPDPRGYRKQFTFWLDGGNDWHLNMGNWLIDLKLRRQFAPTVRNALALYRELRDHKIDLLVEWFPWIKDCFTSPAPPPTDVDELKREIELLKRLVLAQQGGGTTAPKPLTVAPLAPPRQDTGIAPADADDVLTATVDKDAGKRSCNNFIASMEAISRVGAKQQ